jgi:hypothetical protein
LYRLVSASECDSNRLTFAPISSGGVKKLQKCERPASRPLSLSLTRTSVETLPPDLDDLPAGILGGLPAYLEFMGVTSVGELDSLDAEEAQLTLPGLDLNIVSDPPAWRRAS